MSTWSFLSVVHPLRIPIPMYKNKVLRFNKKICTKLAFPPQQKSDTTAQLYCTLSTYVTPKTLRIPIPMCEMKVRVQQENSKVRVQQENYKTLKTISRRNQKKGTTPQLYCTLST